MDEVGVAESEEQPVEFLIDQLLSFVTPDSKADYKVTTVFFFWEVI